MSATFVFGRLCGRRSFPRLLFSIPKRQQCYSRWTQRYSLKDPRQRPYQSRRTLLWAAAALTPGAFVQVSEENLEEGLTHEQEMLKMSRQEISKKVPEDAKGLDRVWRNVVYILDQYFYEPLATTFRFLHLVVIFVPVIISVPIMFIGTRSKERDNERAGVVWWYGFLVKSMERAGPAFVKLGQWAASRTDIFPAQMCKIMSELHSNAKAHSIRHTRKTIEHAFGGRHFDDVFEEFDEKPLGVGAIAQVYKARLKPDLMAEHQDMDEEAARTLQKRIRRNVDSLMKSSPQRVPSSYVAIKVLHPGVERNVRRDLKIMAIFAAIINAVPTLEWLDLPNEVSNFGEMMRLQLDLRIEAANLSLFRKNFANRTTAWFPYPYTDYTTRQVLVEEFAQGIPLSAFLNTGGGVFQKEIANEGLDAFLHMLLIDNFTHSDLHPGNIMVRFYKTATPKVHIPLITTKQDPTQPTSPEEVDHVEEVLARLRPHIGKQPEWDQTLEQIDREGYRPQLIFIDTGLVTELNNKNRKNFLDLFKSIAEFDGYKAGRLMVERCRSPEVVIDEEVFALKMQHLVLAVKGRTFALGNIKIGDVLSQVLSMVRSHHVRMEGDFVNVVISILLLEGIGRSLDPNLDLFKAALPILRKLGSSDPTAILQSFREGDFSLLKIWVGLEARRFFQASTEQVEACVKYDLLSPML
ncbi:hypothetical protein H2198_006153 [Neophaeococcomyces mojaviensis]|uniref:Uncharacterized protein n=1 Tax=Neophaeococcomyces mojaviensis TaxID=3383035 RepID=A0ACC3A3W5_9EURO|nr:hypothetical protein H2198_006153 [Knufia sp. JES_112]